MSIVYIFHSFEHVSSTEGNIITIYLL